MSWDSLHDPMDQLFREACRRYAQDANPGLDEAAFVKIMEEAEDMYDLRLIADACRNRIRRERPDLGEVGVDEIMKFVPFPPMFMVVTALAQRIHLSEEERKQQVATMMASKVC